MINPKLLKKAKEKSSHYPNRASVKCDMVGSDNKTFDADILKEEVNLALYLKVNIFPKISETESTKLLKLIEDYGDMRHFDGGFEETYEG